MKKKWTSSVETKISSFKLRLRGGRRTRENKPNDQRECYPYRPRRQLSMYGYFGQMLERIAQEGGVVTAPVQEVFDVVLRDMV